MLHAVRARRGAAKSRRRDVRSSLLSSSFDLVSRNISQVNPVVFLPVSCLSEGVRKDHYNAACLPVYMQYKTFIGIRERFVPTGAIYIHVVA